MAALANRRFERVAQSLAAMKSAEQASVDAGYPKTSSFAANARKRATYPEIKARVKELQDQQAACMVIDAAWLLGKCAKMAGYEIKPRNASEVISAMSLLAKMLPGALVPTKLDLEHDGTVALRHEDALELIEAAGNTGGAPTSGE